MRCYGAKPASAGVWVIRYPRNREVSRGKGVIPPRASQCSLMVVFGVRGWAARPSVEGLGRMTRVTARHPSGLA